MKQEADKRRRDLQFQVGDSVYLKAQPYRMRSLAQRRNEKLAPRYYGPFFIVDKIGEVAYKLQLPQFMLSFTSVNWKEQPHPEELSEEWELQPRPEDIKELRYDKTGALEVLVQWQNLPEFENSW